MELVRRGNALFNAGDWDADALGELLDPSVIMHAPSGWPEPGPEVGRDAVMRQFQRLRDAWDADSTEPIGAFVDAGDRALVRFIWHTAGQVPGTDMEFTQVATVRDGRIALYEFFWDHAEALKAVGLEE